MLSKTHHRRKRSQPRSCSDTWAERSSGAPTLQYYLQSIWHLRGDTDLLMALKGSLRGSPVTLNTRARVRKVDSSLSGSNFFRSWQLARGMLSPSIMHHPGELSSATYTNDSNHSNWWPSYSTVSSASFSQHFA